MFKKELLASFLILLLLVGGLLSATPLALASSDESGNESNEESNEDTGEENTDEPPSDDTTPPPDGIEEPDPEAKPGPIEDMPTQPVIPVVPGEPEPELFRCPDNTLVESEDSCPTEPIVEERVPLPYCDLQPSNFEGSCFDRKDWDDITGLYPCHDGSQEADFRDCEDLSAPLENQTSPLPPVTSLSLEEEPCPEGQFRTAPGEPCVDCEGPCPEPIPPGDNQTDPIPDPGDNSTDPGDNQTDPTPPITNGTNGNGTEIIINIKTIIKNIENIHKSGGTGKHNFPIDIIGLSVKDNGDAILCVFNIDKDWIQCQDFEMEDNKVNQDFWRVIEVDHSKDYDNGNTGSDDIDDAIDDIKSQDFSELKDADNHDFGIDIGWVAINPQGDGVTCLVKDQSGKGKSLCEPFKVSAQDVDGQITEGVEF